MNVFNVVFPYFLLLIAIVSFLIFLIPVYVLAGILRIAVFHKVHGGYEHVGITRVSGLNRFQMDMLFFVTGIILTLVFFLFIFNLSATRWIRANPTANWENKINNADTAVVFGFGLAKAKDEKMKYSAGEANEFLFNWTMKHTGPKIILVQEGVWIASDICRDKDDCDSICLVAEGKQMKRMHFHDEHNYVDTLDAAFCAIEQLEQLYNDDVISNKVVVIAHDQQLQRAVWDLKKIQKTREAWQKFELIVPEISDTPYPSRSPHWQTQNELLYQVVELFGSRIRDFFASVPTDCKAPCPARRLIEKR